MENTPDTANALAHIPKPEVMDLEAIRTVIGPSIDKALDHAARLAVSIKDDASRELAIDAAEKVRDECVDILERWREREYIPMYREAERTREIFDPRIKAAKAVIKTIMSYVSDYNIKREREARLARERAEAEARMQREEAEKKQREAEAAEARAKQAVEDEKRRKLEAEAAEARRVQAEKEAQERREREAREAAAAETARKVKEAEDAQIKHAEVAQEVGNGAARVDNILESATPIAPVLGKPEQHGDSEKLRLETEQAKRVSDEKAAQEKKASEEAEQRRAAAEAEAKQKREEADAAVAAATSAAAAAASTHIATIPDSRSTGVQRWGWDLDSDGTSEGDRKAMMDLIKAVAEGRAPLSYIGYNHEKPQDFRPPQIGADVTDLKDRFSCPGIKAFLRRDEQLKRRVVGGRR